MLSTPPSACRATGAGWNRGHRRAGEAQWHDGELALPPGPRRGRLARRGSGGVPLARRLPAKAWVRPAKSRRHERRRTSHRLSSLGAAGHRRRSLPPANWRGSGLQTLRHRDAAPTPGTVALVPGHAKPTHNATEHPPRPISTSTLQILRRRALKNGGTSPWKTPLSWCCGGQKTSLLGCHQAMGEEAYEELESM